MKEKKVKIYIEDFSKNGDGFGYLYNEKKDNKEKIIIPNAVIGDEVIVSVSSKKRKGEYKGKIIEIIKPSTLRTAPKCKHTDSCGGCRFQFIKYTDQLKIKEKKVLEAFGSILNKYSVDMYPIASSISPWHYRNKMEFSFSQNGAGTKFLGLMIKGASRYVFNVEKCYLCSDIFSSILNKVYHWWEDSNIEAYNFRNDEGSLRYLTIREGQNTGDIMVTLTVSGNENYQIDSTSLNDFTSEILHVINTDNAKGHRNRNVSIYLQTQKIQKKKQTEFILSKLHGVDSIKEKMTINGHLFSFDISPPSFFQPNTLVAEKIYEKALKLAKVDKTDVVFDLYCGTGTIGIIFSHFVKNVIGIEINESSVINAKENMKKNGTENFQIFLGDVGKKLSEIISKKGFINPDLLIVDPPRAGLDMLAIENILMLKPKKILYISCNPLTQAENIKNLLKYGYLLKAMVPFDQFPHTYHIENIALLELT